MSNLGVGIEQRPYVPISKEKAAELRLLLEKVKQERNPVSATEPPNMREIAVSPATPYTGYFLQNSILIVTQLLDALEPHEPTIRETIRPSPLTFRG